MEDVLAEAKKMYSFVSSTKWGRSLLF
jgi:hypothetical protein